MITKKAKPSILTRLDDLYKKYKRWIYIPASIALISSAYFHGIIKTVFIALIVLLVITFARAFWDIGQWIKRSKNAAQLQRRITGAGITVIGLIALYFIIRLLLFPTALGQSIQDFLWRMF